MSDSIVDAKHLAERLQVTPQTVLAWARRGWIPCMKAGRRPVLFSVIEVEKALNRGERELMPALTARFERALIEQALRHTGGRRIEAAGLLGIGRNTLTRKAQELGVDQKDDDKQEKVRETAELKDSVN